MGSRGTSGKRDCHRAFSRNLNVSTDTMKKIKTAAQTCLDNCNHHFDKTCFLIDLTKRSMIPIDRFLMSLKSE